MARFVTPMEILEIETKNGKLTFETNEYYKIVEDNKRNCLMINKQGINKIEDFFEVEPLVPQIQQQWNNNSNFNFIITIQIKSKFGDSYGCASSNPMNLKGDIARSYPVELGVKRARSTACLELLRKNYIGEEPLSLLYSTFDEFKAENSLNNPDVEENKVNITSKTQTQSKEQEKTQKEIIKPKEIDENNLNEKFKEICFTKKYTDGIRLIDMFVNDKEYFKQVALKPNKYRNISNELLEVLGLDLDSI